MKNREELSEKCSPEKKETGQELKERCEINLEFELVLAVLPQGVFRPMGWFPQRAPSCMNFLL